MHFLVVIIAAILGGILILLSSLQNCSGDLFGLCYVGKAAISIFVIAITLIFVIESSLLVLITRKRNIRLGFIYPISLVLAYITLSVFGTLLQFNQSIQFSASHTPWYNITDLPKTDKWVMVQLDMDTRDTSGTRIVAERVDGTQKRELDVASYGAAFVQKQPAFQGKVQSEIIREIVSPSGKYVVITTLYPFGKPFKDLVHSGTRTDVDQIKILDSARKKLFEIQGINRLYGVPEWSKDETMLLFRTSDSTIIFDMNTLKQYMLFRDINFDGGYIKNVRWFES